MDQHDVTQNSGSGAGERKAFTVERSVRQGCPLSSLLYALALRLLLRRLKDERACPALRGVSLTGRVRAKVSAYADDITNFVSLDILAVKRAVREGGSEESGARRWQVPRSTLTQGVVWARPSAGAKLVGSTG